MTSPRVTRHAKLHKNRLGKDPVDPGGRLAEGVRVVQQVQKRNFTGARWPRSRLTCLRSGLPSWGLLHLAASCYKFNPVESAAHAMRTSTRGAKTKSRVGSLNFDPATARITGVLRHLLASADILLVQECMAAKWLYEAL